MKQTSADRLSAVFQNAVLPHEGSPHRCLLRQKLLLEQPLKHRQVFRVGGIHCELYEYSDVDAPVIIFLAGIGTYCELYARLLQGISESGFHVVGVDLRGHGYSDGDRGALTVEDVKTDIARVLDALETRFSGPFAVYGYSIGATLGASIVASDDRVKAFMGSTLLLPEIAPDSMHQMGWNWTWMSAFWMPNYTVPLQQFIDFKTLVMHTGAVEEIESDPLLVDAYPLKTLSSLFNSRTGLLEVKRPLSVAIIHGDSDEVLPLSYSEKVCENSSLPVELIAVEGQGHMLPWDNVKTNVALVAAWMKRNLV